MFSSDPNYSAPSNPSDPNSTPVNSNAIFSSGSTSLFGAPNSSVPFNSNQSSNLFSAPSSGLFSAPSASALNSNQPSSSLFGSFPSQSIFTPPPDKPEYPPSQSLFGANSIQSYNSNQPSLFSSSNQATAPVFKAQSNTNPGFSFSSTPSNSVQSTNNNSSSFGAAPSFANNATGAGFGSTTSHPNSLFGGSSSASNQPFGGTSNANTSNSTSTFGSGIGTSGSSSGGLFGSTNVPTTSSSGGSLFSTHSNIPPQNNPHTSPFFGVPGSNPSTVGVPGSSGMFGNPCSGFAPNPFGGPLFSHIPLFEDIQVGMNRMPFDIQLTRSGLKADLLVKVNEFDTYHLSSKIMGKFSTCFIISELNSIQELEIETPFPNSMFEALFWLVYSSNSKLFDYITSFRKLLEVYSCFKILQVNNKEAISKMLLNHGKSINIFSSIQTFPESLNREFIDFEFISEIVKLLSIGLFGQSNNTIKCAILLEWLCERNCTSLSEVESLQTSEDFEKVSNFISTFSVFPSSMNEYAALVQRYPIGSKIFSLQMVLKGFNLLRL